MLVKRCQLQLLQIWLDVELILTKRNFDLGGLAIIGTERHESRRIDNQLRGRAGRQGDVVVNHNFIYL